MFGAGGGTSSYREAEETDLIILWGSNARETHPIFFHHLLRGVRNGARLIAVDPRRTSSAEWADVWLGIDVGSDISLANAMARVIIHNDLADKEFIARATNGYEEFARCVEAYTLERAEADTGVPAAAIQEVALAYGRAKTGMICWTLGITEHHNAVDNVVALINLALLTGKVGRYGCGLNPLRGQNNVQGGGDMGAIPARLPGFQDLENPELHEKFARAWGGAEFPMQKGWHLSEMFEAMDRGDLRAVYIVGENPARSEADQTRAVRLLSGLEHLVVQDIFLTQTAQLAHVVLPAAAGWAEFLHARLWKNPVEGARAPFHAVENDPPVDRLTDEFPIRLTTGRRLDSFNTGVQTGEYTSPLRRGEALLISPEDGKRYGVGDGERVRASSRRGSVEVEVRIEPSLRGGLAFMTLHFPDQVSTNVLTIDATDPKSGTAEFKASAIRIDKILVPASS